MLKEGRLGFSYELYVCLDEIHPPQLWVLNITIPSSSLISAIYMHVQCMEFLP